MSTMSTTIVNPLTSSFHPTKPSKNLPKIHSFIHKTPKFTQKFNPLIVTHNSTSKFTRVRSAEEDAQIPEIVSAEEVVEQTDAVAVPVSPADKLLMFFQAEGTMSEAAIPTVTQALQGTEGVSNLQVLISEGIASVELTKQTTIQATGVASGLLETIQGAGFKLNTLNLSFEDEELVTA